MLLSVAEFVLNAVCSDVSLHSWITNSGLQMLKSYPRSYPDLRPDSLGGFSQRQLDFVT